jgi:FKBP-type peptidyl-prolyl cis-trans isomerase 2
MDIVKEGDKIKLECELKLEDGTTYFKNEENKPIIITIGEGKLLPAVENKIIDMKKGETKTVNLEPKDAFGFRKDDLVAEIPKKDFGTDSNIKIGSRVQIKTTSNQIIQGTVTEIKNNNFTVDFNHPLAGKKIVFILTVKSIEKS